MHSEARIHYKMRLKIDLRFTRSKAVHLANFQIDGGFQNQAAGVAN